MWDTIMREEKLTDKLLEDVKWARDFTLEHQKKHGVISYDSSDPEQKKANDILNELVLVINPPPDKDNICDVCGPRYEMSEIHPQGVSPDCSNLAEVAENIVHYLKDEKVLLERFDHPDDEIIFIASHCIEMYDVFRCHGANHYQAMTGVFLEFMFAVCEGWL